MTPSELKAAAEKYRWYHPIDLGGYVTKPDNDFSITWDFIRRELSKLNFEDTEVLDIGCRDCLWSFYAEKAGARIVAAVDNNLSRAALDVALSALNSRVLMSEHNVCDWQRRKDQPGYDIVLMLGVLYHLRFPMMGLFNAIDWLKESGLMCIETAIYMGTPQDKPMLYCPFMDSPYEAGSVSFFNKQGLITVMESLGMKFLYYADLPDNQVGDIRRSFFKFEKGKMLPHLREYWTGIHTAHTAPSEKAWEQNCASKTA